MDFFYYLNWPKSEIYTLKTISMKKYIPRARSEQSKNRIAKVRTRQQVKTNQEVNRNTHLPDWIVKVSFD